MSRSVKVIIIVIVVLAAVALVVFNMAEIGSVFAAMAGGFAAFKAKLFSSPSNVEAEIEEVEAAHGLKRAGWDTVREEYESKYQALRARMDYIDFRTARISQEILTLDDVEKNALEKNKNLTEKEILNRLENL